MNMQTKNKENRTATYCKTNSKKEIELGFKVIVLFMQTQVNETLSLSVTYPAASLLHN